MVNSSFWNNIENQKKFLNWISKELNIQKLEDWYNVKQEIFIEKGGYVLITKYYGNLFYFLKAMYPDFNWKPWLFKKVSPFFWKNKENQKLFIKWLENEFNIKHLNDWYKINTKDVENKGGIGILSHFNDSLYKMLKNIYPDHNWKPWLFLMVPSNFWKTLENQKKYIEWLSSQLNILKLEDWYRVTYNMIIENSGRGLLHHYNNSIIKMLQSIYPHYDWKPWLFSVVQHKFWNDIKNQKKYIDWLAEELNIKTFEDWYSINRYHILSKGGSRLLNFYNGSVYKIVQSIYPEFEWKPWLFEHTPELFWNSNNSVKNYISWLEQKLHIKTLDDWYNISSTDISKYYQGSTLLKKYGGFKSFLMHCYPEYNWNISLFDNIQRKPSKSQLRLFQLIKNIFPNEIIEIDFPHPQLNFKNTQHIMELDIYLPSLNLAFEYQVFHDLF